MTQVSYIVAVDTQRPHLEAMLAGLRGQDGDFSREFVFVDDGSDDGSFEFLIEKTRCWPRTLLIQQRRQGPAAAALTGAKAATGDRWLFLDGDVVLAAGATRLLLAAAQEGGLDMLLAARTVCGAPAKHAFDLPGDAPQAEVVDGVHALLSGAQPPTRLMLMRRGLFRDPGFFDAGVYLPDFAPPLQAALAHRVGVLDAAVGCSLPDAPSLARRGGGQAEYDFSAAVAAFLAAHPELPARSRRAALCGCARRAWRAARANRGAGLTSRFFWLYIKALLRVPMDVSAALDDSLAAWDGADIRRSAPPKG
ncbi:glycosyltransferase family A protein [Oleispirillum naphthae]|uniref:glycosyltransferase family 2 protein n=1 Tax=Oleispirillum naphthae TaxID=2838853 RepID=UPI003082571E